MSNIQSVVSGHPDLQFLPILPMKNPAVETWSKTERRSYNFNNAYGIGLICGSISGEVEIIDVDLKYDKTGDLFKRFKVAINKADKTLLEKLVVQKTVNNGYHLIYRCTERCGNKKLARRFPTDQEKIDHPNEKVKVLIETRGDGGYIACYPTPGYEIVFGSLENIQHISPEQRNLIFDIAGTFNEYFEEYKPIHRAEKKQIKGLSPFEDYNQKADVVFLLEKHGWVVTGTKGGKTLLKRPGDTKAQHSGNFDHDKNWFSVFSTSTQFDPEKGYLPYAVYAILECKSDFSDASKRLYDEGYGDRKEAIQANVSTPPSRIDLLDDDISFLATDEHFLGYLKNIRNGTFMKGRSTGFPVLDKHFLIKDGNFVVINGHDNVGKSVVIWYLALLTAILYGWKWIIFSSENTVGFFYRKMIEFFWCEDIEKMSKERYEQALEFIKLHFNVILSNDDLFNSQDIINMAAKTIKVKKINGLLIDPYNSLKIELTSASKLSTHEYHYEQISALKLFGKQKKLSIYINCHAVTNALRQKDTHGAAMAPQKADTEGGGKFGNKADDFLTIHRKLQSESDWMITEIHVRKIKEIETGGKITPQNAPVKLKAIGHMLGFEDMNGFNPILEFHKIPYDMKKTEIKTAPSFSESKKEIEEPITTEDEYPF